MRPSPVIGRGVSESAGRLATTTRLLWHAPRTVAARRLADVPPVLFRSSRRVGPICIGVAIAWKPAVDRGVESDG